MGNKYVDTVATIGGIFFAFFLLFSVSLCVYKFYIYQKNETNPVSEEITQLVEEGKYEEAYLLLSEHEDTLNSEELDLLYELKTELYHIYTEEANKALEREDYVATLENYKKALEVIPDDEDPTSIEEQIYEIEGLAEKTVQLQEQYNKYMKTFNQTLNQSNEMLSDFKKQLDLLEVGTINNKNFISKVKESYITPSHSLLRNLDSALSVKNDELLSIHKEVVELFNLQHQMFLSSLKINNEDKASTIKELREFYKQIKENQITIIQSLNNFAENNHLDLAEKETGNETIKPSEEDTTVES